MKNIITFINNNSNNRKENVFKVHFPEIYNEICSWKFPDNFKFSQKLYHFINDDSSLSLGLCPICGKRCDWRGFNKTYLTYCSRNCASLDPIHSENIRKGMNERTDEEKELTKRKIKDSKNNMTQEEKYNATIKRIQTINNKGQKFIEDFRNRQRISLIHTLDSRTNEEKIQDSINKSNIWKSKSDLEKSEQIKKMHIGLSEFHNNTEKHNLWKSNIRKANQNKDKSLIKNAKNKEWETKIKKGNINTSLCENIFEHWLISNNISYHKNFNKDYRYPWHVDFFLPKFDMFIEIQGHWTHGPHPFDSNDINDIDILNKWIEKSKYSAFYKSAIDVWTLRDVEKRNVAKENNLNYIEIFSIDPNKIIQEIMKRIRL